MNRRTRHLLWVGAGYAAALGVALAVGATVAGSALWKAVCADVAATLVVFACSVGARNASFYDPYWSVAPPLLAGYFWLAGGAAISVADLAPLALILWWSVRLTGNWARTWQGFETEDWRYGDLRARSGPLWWVVNLFGIHLIPTAVVFLGCLPLHAYYLAGPASDAAAQDWRVAAGLVIIAGAVWLEHRADRALHAFRERRASRAELLDTGIWGRCRHPNYLGEIGFWVGIWVLGGGWDATLLGPVTMIALFVGVSIPMIETKLAADKPGYAAYRAATPMLLPRPRLKG